MAGKPIAVPILIKRYAQGRLYDAAGSRYVTLADLKEWAAKRKAFLVRDVGSGQDVTDTLFAQPTSVD